MAGSTRDINLAIYKWTFLLLLQISATPIHKHDGLLHVHLNNCRARQIKYIHDEKIIHLYLFHNCIVEAPFSVWLVAEGPLQVFDGVHNERPEVPLRWLMFNIYALWASWWASRQAVMSKWQLCPPSPQIQTRRRVKKEFRQRTGRSWAVYESIREVLTGKMT